MATKRATTAKKAAPAGKSASPSSAKKAPVKKAPTKKAPAAKAPVKKSPAAPAKKAPATKAPAKKAPSAATKKAPAKAPATKKAIPAAAKKAPASSTASPPSAKKAPVKQPSNSATSAPEKSPFDAKFLDAQRAALLEERETLSAQAVALKAEADALARDREPGDVQFDDESGEGDTLAVEPATSTWHVPWAALATIEEIDAALVRLDRAPTASASTPVRPSRRNACGRFRTLERVEFKTRSSADTALGGDPTSDPQPQARWTRRAPLRRRCGRRCG